MTKTYDVPFRAASRSRVGVNKVSPVLVRLVLVRRLKYYTSSSSGLNT